MSPSLPLSGVTQKWYCSRPPVYVGLQRNYTAILNTHWLRYTLLPLNTTLHTGCFMCTAGTGFINLNPVRFFYKLVTYLARMTVQFRYNKKQVIHALRYHFLMRPEIKVLLVLINVFAITSAVLFALKKIQAIPFMIFSLLWFLLMLVIWRILPGSIYRKSQTFQDNFSMHFDAENVVLETARGSKGWPWASFSHFVESPYFFHLYFDARSFFLVPKDAFVSITELQEARELMREKINKK